MLTFTYNLNKFRGSQQRISGVDRGCSRVVISVADLRGGGGFPEAGRCLKG